MYEETPPTHNPQVKCRCHLLPPTPLALSDSDIDSYKNKTYTFIDTTVSSPSAPSNHRLPNPDGSFRYPFCAGKKRQSFLLKDLFQHATGIANPPSTPPTLSSSASPNPTSPVISETNTNPSSKPSPKSLEQQFVFNCSDVLANIPIGHPFDSIFSKFHPVAFIPVIVIPGDCSCFVVVRFNWDWSGFHLAVTLENWFNAAGSGRE